ncbi:MAG TPA: helix-turn-helix domain-containing protein [Pyrinomonadaceae bacterium]|jgi:predicted ArsR family transcriptional regulator|nr:helix-turn-helix domain-containing protein [Pyrinomonadaceae bacterium]
MEPTKLDQRFLESTRGRIVTLLRGSSRTVEELAGQLGLTDNAVRAHLTTLERDGLIRQSGMRRGPRKPHFTYSLTPEAERIFPKAYDALLNQLIAALKGRLSDEDLEGVLREVGQTLAAGAPPAKGDDLGSRVQSALTMLESIGGAADVAQEGDRLVIRGGGCPLAAAVSVHPEVCRLAESLISEIVRTPVTEHCNRQGTPSCRFEIGPQP